MLHTTEPSMEVLQLDTKSTSRLSCLTIPPTAMELTSKIAESSMPFSPSGCSTSDVSDEVIIFLWQSNDTPVYHQPPSWDNCWHFRACAAGATNLLHGDRSTKGAPDLSHRRSYFQLKHRYYFLFIKSRRLFFNYLLRFIFIIYRANDKMRSLLIYIYPIF